MLSGPHFILADRPFVCSECGEEFPANSLLMIHRERLAPPVLFGSVKASTKHLCETCGKLLLECY